MDIDEYIGYYRGIVSDQTCRYLQSVETYNWKKSTYSNHSGKVKSEKRVQMDETWVRQGDSGYDQIKEAFEKVIKLYSTDFPLFSVQRTTDFRINRYNEGGFMSSHVDNIHHSHGQQYGYPQVTALLYLNDNYEGGVFKVAGKTIYPEKGSAVIFPSNFMYPHQAGVVTKGTRWSIVSWLM